MGLDARTNALTWKIIGCAIAVHSALGPGLLESAYLAFMLAELRHAGLRVETQVRVPVVYRGLKLDCGYKIDILVENVVVIELKTVSAVLPIHEAQLVTYLSSPENPSACC